MKEKYEYYGNKYIKKITSVVSSFQEELVKDDEISPMEMMNILTRSTAIFFSCFIARIIMESGINKIDEFINSIFEESRKVIMNEISSKIRNSH